MAQRWADENAIKAALERHYIAEIRHPEPTALDDISPQVTVLVCSCGKPLASEAPKMDPVRDAWIAHVLAVIRGDEF